METNPTSTTTAAHPSFFRRLASKGALRVCLFALACLITLIALYHAEENWRGAHVWNKYKQERLAAGESMDWRSVVPPRVPDEQNFAMTPFLAPLFDFEPGTQKARDTNAAAHTRDFAKDFAPNWSWTNDVDLVAFTNDLLHPKNQPANSQPQISDRKEAARAILQKAEQYSPVLDELRRASERHYARFNVAYETEDKISMLLPHLYMLRNITRLLAVRATAELALGQTEQALADTKLALYLAETLKAEPTIISQLVRQVCLRVTVSVIRAGLAEHQWSDAQLQQLQAKLEKIETISEMKLGLDAESKMHAIALEDLKGTYNRLKVIKHWGSVFNSDVTESRNPVAEFLFWVAVPRGWIDFEQLNYRLFYLDKAQNALNMETQSLEPQFAAQADQASQELAAKGLLEKILEHKMILHLAAPTFGKLAQKTAIAQAELKMAQITCALERYRVAHNQYPDELRALTPQFVAACPNDPIKGGQFKYRRMADTFLLYSIGWNATDDGGKTVTTGKKSHVDPAQGDWVWGSVLSF